jgi:ataxin-10
VSLIFHTANPRLIHRSPDEVVTPHQTTLLKIVDSYLQSIQMNATAPTPHGIIKTHRKLSPMLAGCFFELSTYARLAVERALVLPPSTASVSDPSAGISAIESEGAQESTQPSPPAELDVMLPKVCEALVLVTQCIVTITLGADESEHTQEQGITSEYNLKTFFNERRSSDRGLVESLIGALDCP